MRQVLDKQAVFAACGYVPHPGQQRLHDAGPHDAGGARYRAIGCSVRWGKTYAAAHEIVVAALAPNDHDTEWWCVAPLHSLADRCWRAALSILSKNFPEQLVRVSETDGLIEVRGLGGHLSRVFRRSTERGLVALTGASVDGMVIDEASAVPDEIWESSLSTRLLDRKGWVLAISTPRGVGGWWANMLRTGLRGEDGEVFAMRGTAYDNPRLDPAEIDKARARMPDLVFRQEYLAELTARSGRVFDPALVEASAVGAFEDPVPGVEYHAGLDLAATTDRTVLTIARTDAGKMRVVFVDTIAPGLEWAAIVERCARHVRRFNDAPVRADATGAGAPVVEMLRAAGLTVQAFVFSSSSKAALVRAGQLHLERGVVLPRRELCGLAAEMELFQWLDERGDRCGAPSGSHDDHVCSFLLAARWYHVTGEAEGRACVRGQDQIAEREVVMPKVAEPPAAVPVVPDEDPAIAEIIRRAKALAARKAKEAADHLRAITGRHTPHGTDHEPRGGYTGQPRPRPGRFFDLDVRLGD